MYARRHSNKISDPPSPEGLAKYAASIVMPAYIYERRIRGDYMWHDVSDF